MPVAYFDVPECGQVSFHLVSTNYNLDSIQEYMLNWSGLCNREFPTYKAVKTFHDLLIALGYKKYANFKENIALKPISIYEFDENEEAKAYFVDLEECWKYYDNDDQECEMNKTKLDGQKRIIDSIGLKEVAFSIKHGIIDEKYISDLNEKIDILKQNAMFNDFINRILIEFGIIDSIERSV